MGNKLTAVPRLPAAPVEYNAQYMEQLLNILRLYFAQLNSSSPVAAASQGVGTVGVIAALSFSQQDSSGAFIASLPTQADLTNLRTGDVYVDTSASNVLKVKI